MGLCALCGEATLRRVTVLRDHEERPAALGRCPRCGLVQAEERPSDEELERYYSKYCYASEAAWKPSEATDASLDRVADLLEPFRAEAPLLDVGCGTGDSLRAMSRRGWTVEGSELSVVAADRLRQQGFTIHVGPLDQLALPPGRYGAAILSEVVEHLRDPLGVLRAVARLLRPGGVAYLTTPNFDSVSRRLLGWRWRVIGIPEHLSYFATRTLDRSLRAAGLEPIRIWTEGLNPFEIWEGLRHRETAAAGCCTPQCWERTQTLRTATVRSAPARLLKSSVNAVLRRGRLGDTLKALARRAG